jgi:DNA excision repair protein ERCC-3
MVSQTDYVEAGAAETGCSLDVAQAEQCLAGEYADESDDGNQLSYGQAGGTADDAACAWQQRQQARFPDAVISIEVSGTNRSLKPDHPFRPLWVAIDGRLFLERWSPYYSQANDFLAAVAEPVARTRNVHEYKLTSHSLYAGVGVGLDTTSIVGVLERLAKQPLPSKLRRWIQECASSFSRAKLVLQRNYHWVESAQREVIDALLADSIVRNAAETGRIVESTTGGSDWATGSATPQQSAQSFEADELWVDDDALEAMMQDWEAIRGTEYDPRRQPEKESSSGGTAVEVEQLLAAQRERTAAANQHSHAFSIKRGQAELLKERCHELKCPLLEEYDFRQDTATPALHIDKKPTAQLRGYQEKALKQMFGNGRARSGIVVLPCGAGKTLTGIMAAVTMKKATLVLCVNTLSVEQWREQFAHFTTIDYADIHTVTSGRHPTGPIGPRPGRGGNMPRATVVVTTYPMVAYSGRRSAIAARAMDELRRVEWGLLILDEVHQVPAKTFRRVITACPAHAKLGLTATLVREDDRIVDLNFLIGPKLYEANWLDLAAAGHLANVQCSEVWTPMTAEFMSEYLKAAADPRRLWRRRMLYTMNPNKLRTAAFLIAYHEAQGDNILVFCDNIYCLKRYAAALGKQYICGETKQADRTRLLESFRHDDALKCLCISKVGDTALDLPTAAVVVQISATDGSRRQEAQRLGRILRPKPNRQDGSRFNAFFYSLVSRDTDEVLYAAKRQSFLINQGYSFKVVAEASELRHDPELPLHRQTDQLKLLAEVLACDEADAADELAMANSFADEAGGDGLLLSAAPCTTAVRRTLGGLASISGGDELLYQEYSREHRAEVVAGLDRGIQSLPP